MPNRFSRLETSFVIMAFAILIGALFLNKGNTHRKDIKVTMPERPNIGPNNNLLQIANGTLILSVSSTCTQAWKALNLGNSPVRYGWCSAKGAAFPHTILFELAQPHAISGIAIDNRGTKEDLYPGISVKEITVSGSTTAADSGFTPLLSLVAPSGNRREVKLNPPVMVQWLKFVVNSNWGNPDYTEIMELEAYGQPVGPAPQVNAAGVYQTNYGPLKIEQDDTRIRGCYDFAQGRLSGILKGRVMQLEWRQEQNKQSGTAIMALSIKADAFDGFWYENGRWAGEWSGVRGGKAPVCKVTQP